MNMGQEPDATLNEPDESQLPDKPGPEEQLPEEGEQVGQEEADQLEKDGEADVDFLDEEEAEEDDTIDDAEQEEQPHPPDQLPDSQYDDSGEETPPASKGQRRG
jgi:hypothetical protein